MGNYIKIRDKDSESFCIDVDVDFVSLEITSEGLCKSVSFDLKIPEERKQLWQMISHIQPQLQLYKEL